MNPKEQATQQSLGLLSRIQDSLQRYYTDPTKAGEVTLPKLPEESFYKQPARLANFIVENTVGSFLNLPRNLQLGSTQVGTGLAGAILNKGDYGKDLLAGGGRLVKAGVDIASILPGGAFAKTGVALKAPTLTKGILAAGKEGALYGGGYGLAEGLTMASEQPKEQRLNTILGSTGTGAVLGGALGITVPLVGAGLKKTYGYFFPENLTQVTKSLDEKLAPVLREANDIRNKPVETPKLEIPQVLESPKKLREALPNLKRDITEANVQFKQIGQKIVKNVEEFAVTQGTKLESVAPKTKSVTENILTNIALNNKVGAEDIANNLSIEEFGKVRKYLLSIRDKGNVTDKSKAEIGDFVKTIEARYTPKPAQAQYDAITKEVYNRPIEDLNNFAASVSDIIKKTNNLIYENTLDPVNRPRAIQEAIFAQFPQIKQTGTIEDFLGATALRLQLEGNPLYKDLLSAKSYILTAAGQTVESAKRDLVQTQINQANEALNILRGKKDTALNNQINKSSQEITDEITNQIGTFIDSGASQKEVMKYVNQVMKKNFGENWDKTVKPLLLKELPADTVARRIENLTKRIPKDAVQKKEQDVIDNMVRNLFNIAKDEIKAPISPTNPDSVFKTLSEALKNKGKYKQVWEKAKLRVMETFKNDEEAYAILQDYFARNVPDVFRESQAQRVYRTLLKEDGSRFTDLVKQHFTSQTEKREDLILKLQAKLGISQSEAADLSSKIYQYFNTNLESARRAAIDRIITPIVKNQTQKKEAIDKIIEYSNLGIFDNLEYANIVAGKLRLPNLSEENSLFIAKTMDRFQRGEIDKEAALKEIALDLSKSNKIDPLRNEGDFNTLLNSYFYNNIFSSFQTWERNFLGGLNNAFIVRPLTVLGEGIAGKMMKSIGKDLPEGINSLPKGELGQYYKQLFGNLGNASNRFFEVIKDPNYIARTDNPTVRYYFDKGRENQLPKILTTIGRFMEAMDQFNTTLITTAEENLMRNRGYTPEEASQKAFAVSQELLGRGTFGKGYKKGDIISQKIKEQGWIDYFFDTIGNKGYELRGSGRFSNFATTAIFPVIRIAINLQKLKTKLFFPAQLFNVLLKDPANRKLQDYGYLVASGFTMAYAIDKMTKGEIEFEAPRDDKAKKLFYDSGKKPYSVKIGNSYVPFQYLEVFGAPFLAMGAIKAAFQDNPDALNQSVIDKTSTAIQKFVGAYLVSPTYLSTLANILDAYRGINGKTWDQALAYPATGLIPFSGLLRDLNDIIDPIRRQKKSGWDEFKLFYGPLRQGLEPFRDTNLQPVKLNTSELYAPYGIGTANPQRETQYEKRIQEIQQTKFRQEQLKPEKERTDKAKIELEMALRAKDNKYALQIVREQKLTPEEVSSVTNKIKEEEAKAKLTPEELGLYNLSNNQLSQLAKSNPELTPMISKVQSYKKDFVPSSQGIFETLKNMNKEPTPGRIKKARGKKLRAKKISKKVGKTFSFKKKVGVSKPPKITKLKAIKSPKV